MTCIVAAGPEMVFDCREEAEQFAGVLAVTREGAAKVECELYVRLAIETPRWIVVGEWRRKP